ncbi:MAG TPA: HD domain-containing phosphohydrolase [Acidimicrobiia bacterium]|nr:HD domain-containing phosphohydrolase [Acidimicrobiia bacterium]
MTSTPSDAETLRTAEVIATVCLATDLGMGFPLEHGCHATLMAVRFCDILGVDVDITNQVYYGSMLMYTGCTSEAAMGQRVLAGNRLENLVPHLFGGYGERFASLIRSLPPEGVTPIERGVEITRRFPRLIANTREHQTALCEVAEMLTRRLGLPSDISGLFTFLTERWDGNSILKRSKGDDVPLAVRIFILCRDLAFQRLIGGEAHAVEVARERSGHAFDPKLADAFVANADEVFAATTGTESTWVSILDAEPKPWNVLAGGEIDVALAALGDFADLISPFFAAHSAELAQLAGRAAHIAGMEDETIRDIRRAARVHDVGRVAISPEIWEKTDPLSRDDQEQVRLHPYYTERVLSQSAFFRQLSDIARDHHERLDGSGYHRGVGAGSLSKTARLLAAADTFQAMTESRPHRPAREPGDAAAELARLADEGWFDHTMVGAIIEAAGEDVPDMERPAGLTEREAEVIGLLARGMQTKQVATALGISSKTADTHIQNAYRKMGVSTRASATLFAMEHGLVPSGELPISP